MMYPLNPSEEQKKYLKKLKQNAMLIQFFRFFLFFAFLFLWESVPEQARQTSFIFSSAPPRQRKKWRNFFTTARSFGIFLSRSQKRSSVFFWSHCWVLCARSFVGLSQTVCRTGTVSCGFKQSAEIRFGSASHCVARQQYENHHSCRNFRRRLRRHHESVYRLLRNRSG